MVSLVPVAFYGGKLCNGNAASPDWGLAAACLPVHRRLLPPVSAERAVFQCFWAAQKDSVSKCDLCALLSSPYFTKLHRLCSLVSL